MTRSFIGTREQTQISCILHSTMDSKIVLIYECLLVCGISKQWHSWFYSVCR